jgi:DNA mismatch repair ATPase MutS
LARVRQFGGWLGRDTGGADLLGLFIEYLNLIFCLDANAVMLAVAEMRRRQDDLHAVFEIVGSLDAALAVASVRAGGQAWTRPSFAPPGARAVFGDLRHPLLDDCVANSIALGPPTGVLVTGANMTGKSTFLRTLGVNAVLAETIHTVFASRYEAPWLSVHSCITPADDLQAGKSYYQVEVETLVAMLRAAGSENIRLYLFDELFRGTNTLDRIGAASAVLSYLVTGLQSGSEAQSDVRPRCFVLAATHDLELVSLLTPDYAVVHFADQLTDAGLRFDYKLRPGPTTTRNAIALLGVLGAPQEVVAEALGRTERLRKGR